jgi:hypothetical protein
MTYRELLVRLDGWAKDLQSKGLDDVMDSDITVEVEDKIYFVENIAGIDSGEIENLILLLRK